jgi:hypothetical protein
MVLLAKSKSLRKVVEIRVLDDVAQRSHSHIADGLHLKCDHNL